MFLEGMMDSVVVVVVVVVIIIIIIKCFTVFNKRQYRSYRKPQSL